MTSAAPSEPRGLDPLTMLESARQLVHGHASSTDGLWPRAAASLARQALEGLVAELWHRDPDRAALADCRARSQLICLRATFDRDVAQEAAATWAALSRACHHHAYELPPTAAELDSWIDAVERLMAEVVTSDRARSLVQATTAGG